MLTRKEIEAALRGHVASPGLSIREALETALALYDENERLKGGIHPHTQALIGGMTVAAYQTRIQTIEAENESEILRLRSVVEAVRTFAKCDCEKNSIDSHWNDVLAALKGLEGK